MKRNLENLPVSLLDYSDEDIKLVASLGLNGPSIQYKRDLFSLRLTGLSLLQFLKKDIRPLEDKDIEWYKFEDVKSETLIDVDLSEDVQERIEEISQECKDIREAYIQRNLASFIKVYHYETFFWLDDWYNFWIELYPDLRPIQIDYQIYFSILNPKPPTSAQMGFHDLFGTLYSKGMKDIVIPQYLEYLWNDPESREKLIEGVYIPVDNRIAQYSDARAYILSKLKKEESTINSKFCLEHGIFNKGMREAFRQVEKAQKEGKTVTLIP